MNWHGTQNGKQGIIEGKNKRLTVSALPCRSIGLSHENALAPHSDWVSVVIALGLTNQGGLHDILWACSITVLVLMCVAVFFVSFSSCYGNEGMVVFGAFATKKIKKYPAICTNYDDLQESGNTGTPPHEERGHFGQADRA